MTVNHVTEAAISLPFSIDSQGNVGKTISQNQIWADRIKGALNTIRGQRLMRSNYGSDIPDAFMDTVGTMTSTVEREVTRVFDSTFPLLTLIDVIVTFDESNNNLTVDVQYSLPDQTDASLQVGLAVISSNTFLNEVNL